MGRHKKDHALSLVEQLLSKEPANIKVIEEPKQVLQPIKSTPYVERNKPLFWSQIEELVRDSTYDEDIYEVIVPIWWRSMNHETACHYIKDLGFKVKEVQREEVKERTVINIDSAKGCPIHSSYKGYRLFKSCKCEGCKNFYLYNKSVGKKERRAG